MINEEKAKLEIENEETIEIDSNVSLHRVYNWFPYTSWRIKRMLAQIGCRAETIWQGYKATRYEGYCKLYRIIRISDEEIINPCINLDELRIFLPDWIFP